MATLSFISSESLAEFMAKPQDLTYVTGVAYEQFGSFKVEVAFDGLTTAIQFDDLIFPYGSVVKEFDDNGDLIKPS